MKIKHKDIQYVERFDAPNDLKKLCCCNQVHPSTKTGAREVNGMGGEFAKRVRDRSKFKSKNDFLILSFRWQSIHNKTVQRMV